MRLKITTWNRKLQAGSTVPCPNLISAGSSLITPLTSRWVEKHLSPSSLTRAHCMPKGSRRAVLSGSSVSTPNTGRSDRELRIIIMILFAKPFGRNVPEKACFLIYSRSPNNVFYDHANKAAVWIDWKDWPLVFLIDSNGWKKTFFPVILLQLG